MDNLNAVTKLITAFSGGREAERCSHKAQIDICQGAEEVAGSTASLPRPLSRILIPPHIAGPTSRRLEQVESLLRSARLYHARWRDLSWVLCPHG